MRRGKAPDVARRVIVSSPRAMVAEPMSMRQGSKEQSAICCSSVRLVVRNMILAGDRSRWMTGFTRPWVIKSARSTAFPTAATIWVVSPPEASCGSKGSACLSEVPLDPLHEDERVVLARSVAIDARKSAQVRDGTQMTVLLEQRGGAGQVRSRLLGRAIGRLVGRMALSLSSLTAKTSPLVLVARSTCPILPPSRYAV